MGSQGGRAGAKPEAQPGRNGNPEKSGYGLAEGGKFLRHGNGLPMDGKSQGHG